MVDFINSEAHSYRKVYQNRIFGNIFGKNCKVEEMKMLSHLDIREEHLQHIRAWIAGVEKHELSLLQMIWG